MPTKTILSTVSTEQTKKQKTKTVFFNTTI